MDENVPIFVDTITIDPGAFALPAALEEVAPEGVPPEQEDVPAVPPMMIKRLRVFPLLQRHILKKDPRAAEIELKQKQRALYI